MTGEQRRFTFFWRHESPFSQWHPVEFVVEGKVLTRLREDLLPVTPR